MPIPDEEVARLALCGALCRSMNGDRHVFAAAAAVARRLPPELGTHLVDACVLREPSLRDQTPAGREIREVAHGVAEHETREAAASEAERAPDRDSREAALLASARRELRDVEEALRRTAGERDALRARVAELTEENAALSESADVASSLLSAMREAGSDALARTDP